MNHFANPDTALGHGNLSTIPAMAPPPGVTPNLVDPDVPLRTGFIINTVLCISLTTIFVSIRIYAKIAVSREFLLEDYSMVLAYFGLLVWFGLNFATPVNGRHLWDVSLADELVYAQIINVVLVIFAPISFFAKFSVLLQLRRVFTKSRNLIYWLIQSSIWLNLILYLVFMFLGIFQCIPRSALGNPFANGKCLALSDLLITPTILVLLSDVWMLMLPIIIVLKLQLALQRKYAIGAGFLVGLISVVSAVYQLYYTWKLSESGDLTFVVYQVVICAGVQISSLILAAAVPAVPRLWMHLRRIDMEESEPSTFGILPRRQSKDKLVSLKDIERAESALSERAESPFEIHTTTEIKVTSFTLHD